MKQELLRSRRHGVRKPPCHPTNFMDKKITNLFASLSFGGCTPIHRLVFAGSLILAGSGILQGLACFSHLQQPSRLLNTRDRYVGRIQESYLHQQRGLVPINVFVRDFPVFELHHYHVRQLHSLPGRRDSGQQVPLCVVSEAHDQFIHYLNFADGSRDRRDSGIFRDLVYEVLAVKAANA